MKETTYSSYKPEQGFSNYCIGTPKIPKKSSFFFFFTIIYFLETWQKLWDCCKLLYYTDSIY